MLNRTVRYCRCDHPWRGSDDVCGRKTKTEAGSCAPAAVDPYTEVQPATETLDLAMYQRIRDEGLNHSHVMEFATALMDGIGPRLTGSPNADEGQ